MGDVRSAIDGGVRCVNHGDIANESGIGTIAYVTTSATPESELGGPSRLASLTGSANGVVAAADRSQSYRAAEQDKSEQCRSRVRARAPHETDHSRISRADFIMTDPVIMEWACALDFARQPEPIRNRPAAGVTLGIACSPNARTPSRR